MPSPSGALSAVPKATDDTGAERPVDLFATRASAELIIAFSGPLGCGIRTVRTATERALTSAGYEVTTIKLSEFIESALLDGTVAIEGQTADTGAARYRRLQDGGNALRRRFFDDVLAEYAVQKIATLRIADVSGTTQEAYDAHVPRRRAFLIDQLKHPSEVELLRTVYRNLFYLIGVLSVEDRRRSRLRQQQIPEEDVTEIMVRDRDEPESHGQHLDKTLQLADFFVRNDRPNVEFLGENVERFVQLMHGSNGVSPTRHEFGMYLAYASSLASACLSRQVGAAILSESGAVLGTGCNDVPKFGGGLYNAETSVNDARCVKHEAKLCWNDLHKAQVRGSAEQVLRSAGIEITKSAEIANRIYGESRIKDLIEFSRAVHAEMEAIISVARQGGASTVGSSLYATTFPCHSCARHIVAAGITSVYYIEPYEKSLALKLHGDSIALDSDGEGAVGHVAFVHFEGVAPRRYVHMFRPAGARKTGTGEAIDHPLTNSRKVVPEYLDDYREFEVKVVAHWNSKVLAKPSTGSTIQSIPPAS